MYRPLFSRVLTTLLALLLLSGCSQRGPRSYRALPSAGTGALTDGEATNSVGDGDVVAESAGLSSQIGDTGEEERRYEYRSTR